MRPSNKSRSRNKNNNNRNRNVGNVVNRVFDSAGPEGKVRGTPQQIIDKYTTLARDAQLSGDRVAAENFQQHSEHYSRLLGDAQREQAERQAEAQARANKEAENRKPAEPVAEAEETPSAMDVVEVSSPRDDIVETPEAEQKPKPKRNGRARKPRLNGEEDKVAAAEDVSPEGEPTEAQPQG